MILTRRSFVSTSSSAVVSAALPRLSFDGSRDVSTAAGKHSLSDSWDVYDGPRLVAAHVTVPHCPVNFSWRRWEPASWERVWTYHRSVDLPPGLLHGRLILEIERALANVRVSVNGRQVASHQGGFLPIKCEITDAVRQGPNEIEIEVDSRWANVPPSGSPKGPSSVDYYLPGGINGAVTLRLLPRTGIVEAWARPRDVLSSRPALDVFATIGADEHRTVTVTANLLDGATRIGRAVTSLRIDPGSTTVNVTLDDLRNLRLWSPDEPHLYTVSIVLSIGGRKIHASSLRTGFREARFELDGFFVNGKRTRLFGLNRHELFPYVGFAASPRAMRHDAAYLRNELNCNVVRCSHYPQSPAFLDACDELGLMVWEEIPGWQYLGDDVWKQVAVNNVEEMIRRDRNHPSIIVWGTRVNESANDPELYRKTRELAKQLDPSRPSSGSMTSSSRADWKENWHEDVFAFDDYHAAPDGSVGIDPTLPGVPYLLAETVGQFSYGSAKNFLTRYRRAGIPEDQAAQAVRHAQAHDRAAQDDRNAGVIAWCGFDYASPVNAFAGVKCPGVIDTFRIPKLGAAFYMAQVKPEKRLVLEASFYWSARLHPASGAAPIFSNCDELRIFVNDEPHAVLQADRKGYPNLAYPPFFAKLPWSAVASTVLRIDGYIAGSKRISRSFDGDHARDQLWILCDDARITADGVDSTRVYFGIGDRFGNTRPIADGILTVQYSGAGKILGDPEFDLSEGAVGAVWLRSIAGQLGRALVTLAHPQFGRKSIAIEVEGSSKHA